MIALLALLLVYAYIAIGCAVAGALWLKNGRPATGLRREENE